MMILSLVFFSMFTVVAFVPLDNYCHGVTHHGPLFTFSPSDPNVILHPALTQPNYFTTCVVFGLAVQTYLTLHGQPEPIILY